MRKPARPTCTEQCVEIAMAIGARGPINIQCRLVNGKVKVFEINPRFSETTSIRAMVGYNEPDMLIRRHVMGEEIALDFEYEEELILRGLVEYREDPVQLDDGLSAVSIKNWGCDSFFLMTVPD